MCVSLIDERRVEETKVVTTAVDDVKHRKWLFGVILLFLADQPESSIKTRFCDQRNWPIDGNLVSDFENRRSKVALQSDSDDAVKGCSDGVIDACPNDVSNRCPDGSLN